MYVNHAIKDYSLGRTIPCDWALARVFRGIGIKVDKRDGGTYPLSLILMGI